MIKMTSGSGETVTVPYLSLTGIVMSQFVLTYNMSGMWWDRSGTDSSGRDVYCAASASVFDRTYERALPLREPTDVQRFEVTASIPNLRVLLRLPLVDEDTRAKAVELLLRWGVKTERSCLNFLANKTSTRLVPPGTTPDDSTRYPVRMTTEEREVVRAFTDKEKAQARAGRPLPSLEERRVVTNQEVAVEVLAEWRQYAKAGYYPYSHQVLGAELMFSIERLMVWYDMRTGKTLMTMMVMNRMLQDETIEVFVVVAPRTNMYDPWQPELEKQGFEVRVLDGTDEEDEAAIMERSKGNDTFYRRDQRGQNVPTVFVINYERVGRRTEYMLDHWDMSKVGVVMDETSHVKNPKSQRTKALHDLCSYVYSAFTLNGTPLEQGPQDVYAQAKCVDTYGVIWGRTFKEHADKYLMRLGPNLYAPKDKMAYEMLLATTSIRVVRSEADQFSGKDKQMRYIELIPTKAMIEQSENVEAGFVKTEDGIQETSKNKLAVYTFLREICCGYDKYREVESGPFIRTRHELNPKLLWLQAHMVANPTVPLVIYCEFTEIEEWIKELIESLGHKWAGTKARGTLTYLQRLQEDVPDEVMAEFMGAILGYRQHQMDTNVDEEDWIDVPFSYEALRYSPFAIAAAEKKYGQTYIETYHGFKQGRKYSPQERRQQTERFNNGEAHYFICKTTEARGISLHRKPAVAAGIGVYPDIIATSPCWSLGTWDQGLDRCVTVDPKTRKNVCTTVYMLIIKGSIEKLIADALRRKKSVQAELQRDVERVGYSNFVTELVEGMRDALVGNDGDFFDAEEMQARIYCGVPPVARLTKTIVPNKLADHLARKGILPTKNNREAVKWVHDVSVGFEYNDDEHHNIRVAYHLLMGRVGEAQ